MRIALSPQLDDAALALHRAGDRLTVNGLVYDFGPLPEGAVLPRAAVGGDWLASDVTRRAGRLELGLILPCASDAPETVRFPAPIDPVPQGEVALPGQTPGPMAGDPAPGRMDWGQLILPAPPVAPPVHEG